MPPAAYGERTGCCGAASTASAPGGNSALGCGCSDGGIGLSALPGSARAGVRSALSPARPSRPRSPPSPPTLLLETPLAAPGHALTLALRMSTGRVGASVGAGATPSCRMRGECAVAAAARNCCTSCTNTHGAGQRATGGACVRAQHDLKPAPPLPHPSNNSLRGGQSASRVATHNIRSRGGRRLRVAFLRQNALSMRAMGDGGRLFSPAAAGLRAPVHRVGPAPRAAQTSHSRRAQSRAAVADTLSTAISGAGTADQIQESVVFFRENH